MKNGIAKQIMSGYGDLRKSEKKAADYILKNMEQAAELSIDRLAEAAGVSQPTVLRMLRAFGFSGYKDFKYQLVSELAQSEAEQQGEAEPMFGYTLRKQDTLEEIPSYMTATAAGMMEETLKNFSVFLHDCHGGGDDGGDFEELFRQDLSEDGRSHQESASDRYLQCGEFRRCGAGFAGEASLSRPAVQIFQRFILSEDISGKADG